ncbi:MAG: prepilin-type N-terminal cleavage/methylation domain-containing protein [Candidatus Staskawiczbacteria bacterium]|nr:prepilin-type N-terminal cleavage/methylation domain-containing protein [Candidatus Staskawiczbacteria bacterium]
MAQIKFQIKNSGKGFTLIELLVTIAIIGILSAIILFAITQYINKGKDSNISGNLVILIPAGEVYYNNYGSYADFCGSPVVENASDQIPHSSDESCHDSDTPGICCYIDSNGQEWAACAGLFSKPDKKAFCVDSRGVKKEIDKSACESPITKCE